MTADHDFLWLIRTQLARDLRALPATLRSTWSAAAAAQRCLTIADLRELAARKLPRPVFDFIDGAAGDELTARRNQEDLREISLMPRALSGAAETDLATTVLGQRVRVPLIGSPTGGTGVVHPDGEVAIARALNEAGAGYVLSTAATRTLQEVATAAPGPLFFQLYLGPDRALAARLLQEARDRGAGALLLTVDTPGVGSRERDQRHRFMARRITFRSLVGGLTRPRWCYRMLTARHPLSPGLLADAARLENGVRHADLISQQFDPRLSWKDIAWVQDQWDGPIALKGVLRPEDAVRAERLGLAGVVVSNHGGRQFDHAPSVVAALPAIVDAVGPGFEVLFDGGIRRGVDIVTALALGARACMAGRPFVYGLGAAGEAGVRRAIDLLTGELRLAMTLLGASSVGELDRSWLHHSPARPGEFPSTAPRDQLTS